MESWFKIALFWTLLSVAFAKKIGENSKTEESDEDDDFVHPAVMPMMPLYRFQYPVYSPGYQMYSHLEDDDVQPPHARSIHKSNDKNTDFKHTSPLRREVLLYPRPCGWEWDGNMYKWGPCNIFFGGPGFPW